MNNRSCCPTKYIPRKPHNVSAVTSKRVVVEIVLDGDKGGGYAPNEEGAIAKTVGTNAYYEGSQKTVQPGDLKRQGKDETCNGTQLTECQKKKTFCGWTSYARRTQGANTSTCIMITPAR